MGKSQEGSHPEQGSSHAKGRKKEEEGHREEIKDNDVWLKQVPCQASQWREKPVGTDQGVQAPGAVPSGQSVVRVD